MGITHPAAAGHGSWSPSARDTRSTLVIMNYHEYWDYFQSHKTFQFCNITPEPDLIVESVSDGLRGSRANRKPVRMTNVLRKGFRQCTDLAFG